MNEYSPVKLLEFVRDGLIEREHFGVIVKQSDNGAVSKIGQDNNYPFFLRSSAKPLQATLLIDYGLDSFLGLSSEEIAICCSSHSGESCHTKIVKNILNKIGLSEIDLNCGVDLPLSKSAQNELLLSGENATSIHNNCSGKHAMMLGLCKKNGWDTFGYEKLEHPLQQAIKKKVYELCELKSEYPITKDGCGVPICSMPLKNAIKGFQNVFLNPRYEKIKEAFVKHPYLIAGEKRLDTAIMTVNPSVICKSGACGLHILINLNTKAGLAVKICDSDSDAQAIILFEALKQLGWFTEEMLNHESVKELNKKDILTLHNDKVGEAKCCFDL